jgi:hypothetical protein
VHSSDSPPAETFSPSAQDTLAPPTLIEARPFSTPPRLIVGPIGRSTSAPSPLRVTVHEFVSQENLSLLNEQPVRESRPRPPASTAPARAFGDVVMPGA